MPTSSKADYQHRTTQAITWLVNSTDDGPIRQWAIEVIQKSIDFEFPEPTNPPDTKAVQYQPVYRLMEHDYIEVIHNNELWGIIALDRRGWKYLQQGTDRYSHPYTTVEDCKIALEHHLTNSAHITHTTAPHTQNHHQSTTPSSHTIPLGAVPTAQW